jgi:SAM-dependent methyltransferase
VGVLLNPSPWVQRFATLLVPGAQVLDLACGSGRHLRWLVAQGFQLTGVDRDAAAAEPLRAVAEIVIADIESGPWPLAGRRFDGIVITNYLWRPLWPLLLASLNEGGVFIHETFAHGQQLVGKPSRPEFLLQPGELLQACTGLRVVAFEDGFETLGGSGRYVQRIAAVQAPLHGPAPPRYGLHGSGG